MAGIEAGASLQAGRQFGRAEAGGRERYRRATLPRVVPTMTVSGLLRASIGSSVMPSASTAASERSWFAGVEELGLIYRQLSERTPRSGPYPAPTLASAWRLDVRVLAGMGLSLSCGMDTDGGKLQAIQPTPRDHRRPFPALRRHSVWLSGRRTLVQAVRSNGGMGEPGRHGGTFTRPTSTPYRASVPQDASRSVGV